MIAHQRRLRLQAAFPAQRGARRHNPYDVYRMAASAVDSTSSILLGLSGSEHLLLLSCIGAPPHLFRMVERGLEHNPAQAILNGVVSHFRAARFRNTCLFVGRGGVSESGCRRTSKSPLTCFFLLLDCMCIDVPTTRP